MTNTLDTNSERARGTPLHQKSLADLGPPEGDLLTVLRRHKPCTSQESASVPLASEGETTQVITAAKTAFPAWRDTSLSQNT